MSRSGHERILLKYLQHSAAPAEHSHPSLTTAAEDIISLLPDVDSDEGNSQASVNGSESAANIEFTDEEAKEEKEEEEEEEEEEEN